MLPVVCGLVPSYGDGCWCCWFLVALVALVPTVWLSSIRQISGLIMQRVFHEMPPSKAMSWDDSFDVLFEGAFLRNIPFRLSNNPAPDYYLGVPFNRPLNNNPAPDYYLGTCYINTN